MNIKDIKIPNSNFIVAEFVPTELYDGYRPNRFTRYCNLQLVEFAQDIRNHFGKSMTINNKVYGGPYNYRGYRYSGCNIVAPKGAHYRNCAIDFNIKGLTDLEVRQELVKNYKELNITILEDGMNGWCHAGFEWFMGHEQDLAIFDIIDNKITFLNDVSNYKVRMT